MVSASFSCFFTGVKELISEIVYDYSLVPRLSTHNSLPNVGGKPGYEASRITVLVN